MKTEKFYVAHFHHSASTQHLLIFTSYSNIKNIRNEIINNDNCIPLFKVDYIKIKINKIILVKYVYVHT